MNYFKKIAIFVIGLSTVFGLNQLNAMENQRQKQDTLTPEILVNMIDNELKLNVSNGVLVISRVQRCLKDQGQTFVSLKNSSQQTALHIAARDGLLEAVQLILLASGKDKLDLIRAQDSNNCTALKLAKRNQQDDIAKAIKAMTLAQRNSMSKSSSRYG